MTRATRNKKPRTLKVKVLHLHVTRTGRKVTLTAVNQADSIGDRLRFFGGSHKNDIMQDYIDIGGLTNSGDIIGLWLPSILNPEKTFVKRYTKVAYAESVFDQITRQLKALFVELDGIRLKRV